MDPWYVASLASFAVMAGALAWAPAKRWIKKCKRRKGGVYGYRVRHHLNPARRVWGYIGESVSFYFRNRQHMGTSNYAVAGGKRTTVAARVPAQPWSDLDPVMHVIIPLPWWLCWKWVLRPLETLVMLLTWPVYNDAKNHWNPRRITKSQARAQRAARDAGDLSYRVRVTVGRWTGMALRIAGGLLILAGVIGALITL